MEWTYDSPIRLLTQPALLQCALELGAHGEQVMMTAYSFDHFEICQMLASHGERAMVLLDHDYFLDGKCTNGFARVKYLIKSGVKVRLSKSWPTDLSAAPPIPFVGRRGADGLLGTGELATRRGESDVTELPYPLDIANRTDLSVMRPSMRWVATLVERRFDFLHAKMMLTDKGLIIGSMNWTQNSAGSAFELGVLLQTEREIHEAYQLFMLLWCAAEEYSLDTVLRVEEFKGRARQSQPGPREIRVGGDVPHQPERRITRESGWRPNRGRGPTAATVCPHQHGATDGGGARGSTGEAPSTHTHAAR